MRYRRINKLTYLILIVILIIIIKNFEIVVLLLSSLAISIVIVNQILKYISSNSYRIKDLSEIDNMKGEEFEQFLAVKYKDMGYRVKSTRKTGDYGADLILEKGFERIIVQVKRYASTVGVSAVQEAISAKTFYNGTGVMVITNNYFTKNSKILAAKCNVKLIDRDILIKTIL